MSSSSSTEAPPLGPGALVAGFRLERLIGRGSLGSVYEATQVSLDRRVALRLVAPDPELSERFSDLAWPEHPNVVDMYAAGTYEHGQFVAMQLVDGSTLAELHGAGRLSPAQTLGALGQVAVALDAAHGEGIAHGAVNGRNVLFDGDGRALVSDFGLGSSEPTPTADRVAFAALVRECFGDHLPAPADLPASAGAIVEAAGRALPETLLRERGTARRRRRLALAAAVGLGAAAVLVLLLGGGDERAETAPPLEKGARALGSTLAPAGVSSVDCEGRTPTGSSQACTVLQTRLPGRPLVAAQDGAIRSWAVRGARGELALQVMRRRGDGHVWRVRTPYEHVPDGGVHVLPANLPIRAGDVVGLDVAPGAAIGVRRTVRGARTARWLGPLVLPTLGVKRGDAAGFDFEVLLRVAYVPGRVPDFGALSGRAAERAPAGRPLGTQDVEPRPGQIRALTVVRVQDRIALDLFDGRRRLARVRVADADPRGRLLDLIAFGRPLLALRWRNPDGQTIGHEYSILRNAIVPRS